MWKGFIGFSRACWTKYNKSAGVINLVSSIVFLDILEAEMYFLPDRVCLFISGVGFSGISKLWLGLWDFSFSLYSGLGLRGLQLRGLKKGFGFDVWGSWVYGFGSVFTC